MDGIINAGRRDETDQHVAHFVAIADGEARVHNCIAAPTQIGVAFLLVGALEIKAVDCSQPT